MAMYIKPEGEMGKNTLRSHAIKFVRSESEYVLAKSSIYL